MPLHPFTTPTVLQHAYHNATPGRRLEALVGVLIALACVLFWYWLSHQSQFAFGIVEAVQSVGPLEAVAQLATPAGKDFILDQVDLLDDLKQQWIFAVGERVGDGTPQLLQTTQIQSIEVFLSMLALPAKAWLKALADTQYLAILGAGVLLLASGRAFRFAYSLGVTLCVCFTAYHAIYAGMWLGLWRVDLMGLSVLLIVVALLTLRASFAHSQLAVVESLMALALWMACGETVLAAFGLEHEAWRLLVFAVAIFCPTVVSALIAAFLLAQAFHATDTGAQLIALVAIGLAATQLFGAQPLRRYAVEAITPLKARLAKSTRPWPKGRVTLEELLRGES